MHHDSLNYSVTHSHTIHSHAETCHSITPSLALAGATQVSFVLAGAATQVSFVLAGAALGGPGAGPAQLPSRWQARHRCRLCWQAQRLGPGTGHARVGRREFVLAGAALAGHTPGPCARGGGSFRVGRRDKVSFVLAGAAL